VTSFEQFCAARGLVSVAAPQGVECWSGAVGDVEGMSVSVVVEAAAVTAEIDVAFINGVLGTLPLHVGRAAAAVLDALGGVQGGENPAIWGPEATFFAGQEWAIRFANISRPDLKELGAMVFFDRYEVSAISDLSDAEVLA
jgi:hypothetical protein